MKIAIDVSQVIYGTGVSTYTRNLVKNLLAIDKENEYILFGGSLRRRHELKEFLHTLQVTDPEGFLPESETPKSRRPTRRGSTFKRRVFLIPPTFADLLWNRLHVLPIEWLIGEVDVFHSSDWAQPPSKSFKVTTVHDLVPFKFPKISHPKIVAAHKARLRWVKKEVDRVIVPSKATMKDLVGLGLDEDKIRVIPEAPDPIFKTATKVEVERLKSAHRISDNYLLAVGITPRKNIERIVEAFEMMKSGRNLKLVIIGEEKMKIEARRGVLKLGHVASEEMSIFYSGAAALIYPSLYEGFGLPVLEAFACKTPVVTSRSGSMKEVAGGAAVLVDPYDVDSVAEGIKKALKDRKELVEKGVKRVKDFSWKKTAKKTLNVYKEVS